MRAPSSHAQEMDTATTILRPPDTVIGVAGTPYSAELIKKLVAAMEVPFDPSQIEWRVMYTTKNQQPARAEGDSVLREIEQMEASINATC